MRDVAGKSADSGRRPGGGAVTRATLLAVVLLLVAGCLLRWATVEARAGWEHDDVLVFAAGSGHPASDWTALEGRWVPAGQWAALLVPRAGTSPGEIAARIPEYGHVHPPLWYWTVHAWTRVFGVSLRSVPLLNGLFSIASGLVLFSLARRLLGSALAALPALAFWAFSPGAIGVTALERPYELLTLLTVSLAWLLLPFPGQGERVPATRLLAIVAVSAAGLLLHYQFLFVLAACGVVLALPSRTGPGARLALAGALACGCVVHVLLFPGFARAFALAAPPAAEAAPGAGFLDRLASPVQPGVSLLDHSFFTTPWREPWSPLLAFLWAAALVSLAVLAFVAWRRPRDSRGAQAGGTGLRGAGLAFLLGVAILVVAQASYLAGLSPGHAVTSRYVANAYPLLALGLAGALQLVPRRRGAWTAALVALQLGSGVAFLFAARAEAMAGLEGLSVVAGADAVVVDSPQPGIMPRVTALLPSDVPVYAAWRKDLLEHPEPWTAALPAGCRSVVLVSSGYRWDPNWSYDEQAVVNLFEGAFEPSGPARPLLRIGTVRRFARRTGETQVPGVPR